jgi:hypothetical protein
VPRRVLRVDAVVGRHAAGSAAVARKRFGFGASRGVEVQRVIIEMSKDVGLSRRHASQLLLLLLLSEVI